uniref:RNA polymerase III subunit Rpc25 domain-containing protein n=1 Tax=Poecilia reticulata TaxID=8081 RepID=A0A3P9NL56_POERE
MSKDANKELVQSLRLILLIVSSLHIKLVHIKYLFYSISSGYLNSCAFTPQSDEAEQVWVWEYETDEGAHDLYMDQGEEIRFRVADEVFVDTSPTGPATAKPDTPAQPGQSTAPPAEESGDKKEAPYTLVVRTVTIIIAKSQF